MTKSHPSSLAPRRDLSRQSSSPIPVLMATAHLVNRLRHARILREHVDSTSRPRRWKSFGARGPSASPAELVCKQCHTWSRPISHLRSSTLAHSVTGPSSELSPPSRYPDSVATTVEPGTYGEESHHGAYIALSESHTPSHRSMGTVDGDNCGEKDGPTPPGSCSKDIGAYGKNVAREEKTERSGSPNHP
jgi:hypothetical protein